MTADRNRTPPSAPNDLADGLVVVTSNSEHLIATWRNVVIAIWRGETKPAAVERLRMVLNRAYDEHRSKVALLQYVYEDAPLPLDKDLREVIAKMLTDARRCVACSCMVAPGSGFRIAAGRAIVTGIAMLARPGFPHVVFPTLNEAAEWQARLLPHVGPRPVTGIELTNRVERLIFQMDEGAKRSTADPLPSISP